MVKIIVFLLRFNVNPETALTFDNPQQNSGFLAEWKKDNYEKTLLKTVRYCEIYHRKRLLGDEFKFQFENIDQLNPSKTNEDAKEAEDFEEHTSNTVGVQGGNQAQQLPVKPDPTNLKIDCAKVIRFIKESRVDHFLVGIYRGTLESDRHVKFMAHKTEDSPDDYLSEEIPFGPITDEEMQDELTDYCRVLFESNFDREKFPGYRAYVYSVWIPEVSCFFVVFYNFYSHFLF